MLVEDQRTRLYGRVDVDVVEASDFDIAVEGVVVLWEC
jgi:hypothetical protein